MAHTIKLKYGHPTAGWSYIDLTDSTHGILDYAPATAAEGADDVVESGIFRIAGASVAAWTAAIEAIDDIFHRAADYEREQTGAWQVRVTFQGSGEANTWEAALYEGRVEVPSEILGVDWANLDAEATITWRRAANWERVANITATNDNSGTQKIFNSNDGTGSSPNKRENWLGIGAAQVPGNQPAPTSIMMEITTAGSVDQVIIINNAKSRPGTVLYTYEGETGTSDGTDAFRSGGKYKDVTVPADTTGTTKEWDADGNLLSVQTGAWMRCLLSATFTGTVKFTPYISVAGVKYYGASSIITQDGTAWQVMDLGMLRLADFIGTYEFAATWSAVKVGVRMICAAGATVRVDYCMFIPVDSMVRVKLDTPAVTGDFIHINCHDNRVYTVGSLGALKGSGTIVGGLYLEPNLAQQLIFRLFSGAKNTDTMADSAVVSVFGWLRRRTL